MKAIQKINNYFLGSEATKSDLAWFYGFYAIIMLLLLISIGGVN